MSDIFDQIAAQNPNTTNAPQQNPNGRTDVFDKLSTGQPTTTAQTQQPKPTYGQQVSDNIHNDPYLGVNAGFAKGLGTTAYDLSELANRGIRAVGHVVAPEATDKYIPAMPEKEDAMESLTGQRDMLTPTTTAQKAGYYGEEAAEWMAGEGLLKGALKLTKAGKVLEAAKLLENFPRIAGALKMAGRVGEATTVGAAQGYLHNQTAEGAEQGAEAGALGGTLGEAVGGLMKGVKAVRNAVASGTKMTAEDVASQGSNITDSISGGKPVPPQSQIVKDVQGHLDTAESAMHDNYDAGLKQIGQNAQDVQVNVQGSPLQKTAKELLGDSSVLPGSIQDSLKGVVPDKDKIEPLLKVLASGKDGKNPLSLSWEETESLRQSLGQKIRDLAPDSPIKGDLIKIRGSIDATMQEAATQAGKPDVAQSIAALRTDYAGKVQQFNEKAIQSLRNSDPDSIANILMNKNSIHNVSNLRGLIGPENMKTVEAGLFDRILNQGANVDGSLNPKAIVNGYKKLAPDVKQAVWGSRVADIDKFMNSVSNIDKANTSGLVKVGLMGLSGAHLAYQTATGDVSPKTAAAEGAMLAIGMGHGKIAIAGKALSNPIILKPITSILTSAAKFAETHEPAARKMVTIGVAQLMSALQASHSREIAETGNNTQE